jgi:Protein phosphatase 2C
MKIYTTLHIGEHHSNYCEDYLLVAEIGKNKILCAVMDGCSMGTDSYFSATLTGKILRKIAKELQFREFVEQETKNPAQLLQIVLQQLFENFRSFKNQLHLEREETLNTLLITVVDTTERSGEFMCIGDGLICIDSQFFEFEQDNRPDYLGYHLNEDFDSWFASQEQKISRADLKTFSLSTDGIFTFKEFDLGSYDRPKNIIDFLLVDEEGGQNSNMLNRKMIEIKTTWGLKPTDDLAIIRVTLDK